MTPFTFYLTFCLVYLVRFSTPLSTHAPFSLPFSSFPTATQQYGFLNTIPLAFFVTRPRQPFYPKSYSLLFLLLLSGDIHTHPGPSLSPSTPSNINLCTLNIRSLTNPLHYTALADIAETQNINIFAITETWITPSTTFAELADATPPGFTLISTPRPPPSSNTNKKIIGGGTAFVINDSLTILSSTSKIYKSFEMSSVTLKLLNCKFTILNLYRNHYYINNSPNKISKSISNHRPLVPFSDFLSDFQSLISTAATTPHNFLITGDFNIHIDDLSDPHTQAFLSILDNSNLTQHVHFPTHRDGHTLDLIITTRDSPLLPKITHSPISPSDHFPVFTSLELSHTPPIPLQTHFFRSIKSINSNNFLRDILNSPLIVNPPSTLHDLVDCYNTTLSSLLDIHAPLKSKLFRPKPPNPWFTRDLKRLKSARRKLQSKWRMSHSFEDLRILKSATNFYHAAIIKAKKLYNSSLISSHLSDPRRLWNSINKLLHRNIAPSLPSTIPVTSLPQSFADFFVNKILKLRSTFSSSSSYSEPHPSFTPPDFSTFQPATYEEVSSLISHSSDTYCDLDPIPTSLLKFCKSALIPTITNIINLSISSGIFPDQFKSCSVHPLLKKPNLDKENLSNYRPISHLSYLSKLTERLVKNRLTDHLSQNNLLNSFQSAYTKFNSTETTLLSLHDHIIQAMSHQQVTALCLLDLSAAFDTIDHSILLQRLSSWFGINNTALLWIKSYLSSRFFSVAINNLKSSPLQLLYGVPQGSVLGPLLFILYTTPLSSIISRSFVNHKLYADDTQLFLSFSPSQFANSIHLLQNTISEISSWMASNFLSLNPSKTEFLLFGTPAQLTKISEPTLTLSSDTIIKPASSARNLGIIFDSNLSFSDHISHLSKTCFSHIRDLRRIRNTLDHTTACTIATSLIHSKLDYCNSLFLNITTHQLDRLQLIQNAAARAITKLPKFSHVTPLLKSLHWLKIKQRIQYKILSITYKSLKYNQPLSINNLISIQNIRSTRSSSVVTLLRPSVSSRLHISNRSFSTAAPVLWNDLLPKNLRSYSPTHTLSISPSLFHKHLKTLLFTHSFPP
jgi:Reverse transcriptase (RNA-dependent DNA polymerase)/Endonuclease-reverse transcriptase